MFAEKSFVHENKLFLYGCTKCFVRLNRMFCIFAQNVLYGGTKHFTRLNRLFLWQLTEGFVNKIYSYVCTKCFVRLNRMFCMFAQNVLYGGTKHFIRLNRLFRSQLTKGFVGVNEMFYTAEANVLQQGGTQWVGRLNCMFWYVLYGWAQCFVRWNKKSFFTCD